MRLCDKCGEYSKVRRRETPFETTFYSLYTTYFNTSVVDYICKKCGERETDKLVWLDEWVVECQTCGHKYVP